MEKYIAILKSSAVRDVQYCTDDKLDQLEDWPDLPDAEVFLGVYGGSEDKAIMAAAASIGTAPSNIRLISLNNQTEGCYAATVALTRIRSSESSSWSGVYTVSLNKMEYDCLNGFRSEDLRAAKMKQLLVARIQRCLQSKKGWAEICEASLDYNWGDCVMGCFEEANGCLDLGAACGSNHLYLSLLVDQDELLAPYYVPICWRCYKPGQDAPYDQDEGAIFNMQTGEITLSDAYWRRTDLCTNDLSDRSVVERAEIILPNGDVLECDPEEDFLKAKEI